MQRADGDGDQTIDREIRDVSNASPLPSSCSRGGRSVGLLTDTRINAAIPLHVFGGVIHQV